MAEEGYNTNTDTICEHCKENLAVWLVGGCMFFCDTCTDKWKDDPSFLSESIHWIGEGDYDDEEENPPMGQQKLLDSVPHEGLKKAKEALMSTPQNIVLVCGSRTWADRERLWRKLDEIHTVTPITMVVHGKAKGADILGGQWASYNGVGVREFPANWRAHGNRAGYIRNTEMAKWLKEQQDNGHIVFVLGAQVGDSRGTAHMINYCMSLGLHGTVIKKEA